MSLLDNFEWPAINTFAGLILYSLVTYMIIVLFSYCCEPSEEETTIEVEKEMKKAEGKAMRKKNLEERKKA